MLRLSTAILLSITVACGVPAPEKHPVLCIATVNGKASHIATAESCGSETFTDCVIGARSGICQIPKLNESVDPQIKKEADRAWNMYQQSVIKDLR